MKRMTKLLSLMLAALMLVGMLPLGVWAAGETHTVRFNLNYNGAPKLSDQQVADGDYAAQPEGVVRDGWHFSYWYVKLGNNQIEKFDLATTPITKDVTLYARWTEDTLARAEKMAQGLELAKRMEEKEETYTVTFEANGEDVVNLPAAQRVKKGEKAIEPAAPLRAGFTFEGWYTDAELTERYDFSAQVTGSITLYAKWVEGESSDDFYRRTSEIIDIINVNASDDVQTESEVVAFLSERGFTEQPITYDYSMEGEYIGDSSVSENSSDKHPMYQTIYISKKAELWVIYVINGCIFANPVSFNLESSLGVELILSEAASLTSFASDANSFYVIIPHSDIELVRTISRIDAETLDEIAFNQNGEIVYTISSSPTYSTQQDNSPITHSDETTSPQLLRTNTSQVNDPIIVLSLGDSYASGESIEPFYGQNKKTLDKIKDEDWLAHRSTKSWPSMIRIPDEYGILSDCMSDHKIDNHRSSSANIQWYFVASSGATTEHIKKKSQRKDYKQEISYFDDISSLSQNDEVVYDIFGVPYVKGYKDLAPQLSVLSNINGEVDFVTLSIGGNDVNFAGIVKDGVVFNSPYFTPNKLDDMMAALWKNFHITRSNLVEVYKDIQDAVGPQAEIIVTGYPKLFNKTGGGGLVHEKEATIVNDNVTLFNIEIEEIVFACQKAGMKIHFVNIEEEFDKNGGHMAYTSDPWLEGIILLAMYEDLDQTAIGSPYSVHPNEKGAQAYARCVNAKIAQIVSEKYKKNIHGKITIADEDTDMTNNLPLEGAEITIKITNYMEKVVTSDQNGEYELTDIPVGTYTITVTKEGFIPVTETITVGENDQDIIYNIAIEAIPEAYNGIGYASGTIYDVATGRPVSGMTLYIRNGLENITGDVVAIIHMNDKYTYSTTIGLPAGNYTVQIVDERTGISEDARYITSSFNIKILGGMTIGNQNGYVSNKITAEEIRIVLTWGATPSDLDSHLVGPDAAGGKFHVYYYNKRYGSEVDLDVDDTSSYGPETITIHSSRAGTYTYAVHDYTNRSSSYSTALSNSGAQIKVYKGAKLIATYNVPANKDGTLWTVFTYDGATGQITTVNTMTYDSSSGGSLLNTVALRSVETSVQYDDIYMLMMDDVLANVK